MPDGAIDLDHLQGGFLSPLVAGPVFRAAGRREADGRLALWTEGADARTRRKADAEG